MREAAVVSEPNPLQRIPGVAMVLVLLIALFSVIAPIPTCWCNRPS